jgi:hypothetical protein
MSDRNGTGPVIDTRSSFAEALRWGFGRAIEGGARRITCVDPQFAEWPLDDAALLSRLAGFLRLPGRRLVLLAADFEALARRHARFDAWRADWAHATESFTPPEEDRFELPTLLVDDRDTVVELFDAVRWRGRATAEAQAARTAREGADALLQRSAPAYPVKRLGL